MSVARRSPSQIRKWLATDPAIEELAGAFPKEWRRVQQDLGQMLATKDTAQIEEYIAQLSRPDRRRSQHQIGGKRGDDALMSSQVRRHLAVAVLRQIRMQAATGITDGRIRFNLPNGYVAQKLLFVEDLERKPVSLGWFKMVWPLLWQKRLLMPLVERQGIYCFYSKPLIKRLVDLIGDRKCLEIAAGDGTLARFLTDKGAQVTATDDHSWSKNVTYPDNVARLDAVTSLRRFRPKVVVCSWPPAGNTFEKEVFRTETVDTYIVIGGGSESNFGNWAEYRKQSTFTMEESSELSRLVLPPELGPRVLVFQRTESVPDPQAA